MTGNSLLKKINMLCAVLSMSAGAFAVDFGGMINNSSTLKNDTAGKYFLQQQDDVTLWLKVPFGANSKSYFITEGLYKFEYNSLAGTFSNYADLNLLKFCFIKDFGSSQLEFDLGRFALCDLTGIIFTQNSDGGFVKYSAKNFDISFLASYTGLLNGNVVKMIKTPDAAAVDASKVYSFGTGFVNAVFTAGFKNLFAQQNLGVQLIANLHFGNQNYNRFYGTVALDGPVFNNLMYSLTGTAEVILDNNNQVKVSPLVKADLSYYFPALMLNAHMIFAGNDFSGITSQTAIKSCSEPEYTAMIKTGLNMSYKPLNVLLISAGCDAVFDGNKGYEFKGLEYNAAVDYQVVSDVSLGLSWNHYIDFNKSDSSCQNLTAKVKLAF